MKKINIIQDSDYKKFENIDQYLLHTYGERKLEESKKDSNPTFLDVIGYTLDKRGFETVEGKYYDLDELDYTLIDEDQEG